MKRQRLDGLIIERGFAPDAARAFIFVTEGRVFVNGQKAVSPAQPVDELDAIEVRPGREFVGRGAYKLEAAFRAWGIDVRGAVCADIGAATGGFTEVLLKHGARKVYAIDAGRGKLDLKLREHPQVVVMEETNVLTMAPLSEPIDFFTVDVSFTSLRLVLPKVRAWLSAKGTIVALFKPQYEIADTTLLKHGVLRDEQVRAELIKAFRSWLGANNWRERGMIESPIRGSEGNIEYLFHLELV